MSEPEYIPSYITPEQFMLLVEIEDKNELIEYLDEGIIDYNRKNGEVYFTEQNVIDYLCPDDFWDEEDKPNTLHEMNKYKTLESDWPDIAEEAEEIEIDLDFLDEEGSKPDTEEEGESSQQKICLVCDDKNTHSKNLCRDHYNKVYYDYDEVTSETIKKYINGESTEKWSRDYDECRRCSTTDREHHGQGYCKQCYYKEYHSPNKKEAKAR